MIRPKEPWIAQGEEGLQEIESPGRTRPDEPMPGKVPGRKVPGVELGELAYVEGDALRRLRFVEIHQRGEIIFPVGPEMTLFGAGREVGGLEPVLDGLSGELVAEDPVEGVGEGGQQR